MPAVDFGLMLRSNQPETSLSDVLEFNRRCIDTLSQGFTTLWLEDHLQWREAQDTCKNLS